MSRAMTSDRQNSRVLRCAVTSALAASLLAGCAGGNHLSKANDYGARSEARAQNGSSRDIAKAEAAVAEAPRQLAARVALANAYLAAGRFESAATTYNDAIALGDSSPRTALSLALAHIGAGRNRDAVALLDQWRDSIPASDLGLALALAGETGRGVAILSDGLRGGENTVKLRQNLAYAYALDGRWREARVMVAQDVPADQIDARISAWAMLGKPEDYQKRVAGLLGAPTVAGDAGQPAYLALNGAAPASDGAPALAVTEPAAAKAAPQVASAGSSGELPALETAPTDWSQAYAAAPQPAPTPLAAAPAPAEPGRFDAAFAAPAAAPSKYISKPVVEPIAAKAIESAWTPSHSPARRADARLSHAAVQAPIDPADCTHLVQLGSFSSEERARRAWDIYRAEHPELRDHALAITPAIVRGRKYWRVAAAGFDKGSAARMCSTVAGRGGGCIAYAEDRPLPGALPGARGTGVMRARR